MDTLVNFLRPGLLRVSRVIRGDDSRTATARVTLSEFLVLSLQLALVATVIHLFRIEEGAGFLRILPVILGGFAIHAWLPLPLRPPFLLSLTFVAIAINFGYPHGVMLVGAGAGLFVLAHLPVKFWVRVALLIAAAVVLVALRAEWIQTRWMNLPVLVLPVLASMFMFRMVIYMYDSRHLKSMGNVWERMSYFFMLPNVCFLLFPVVDFQTYRRSYYSSDATNIYQKGISWIMRGVVQLVVYRFVYYHWLPSPSDVVGVMVLAQYMLATYLLYLRISGMFHVIIGILCLFGYNLPETHHLYYLASSFNDYWRRINIYWKDFMMKIFYYPVFMRLRKFGMTTAIVLSTMVVFAGTWLLHAYQWFWLRGSFLLTATDVLFWTILGLLVVVNSVVEAKRGRKQTLGKQPWSIRRAFVHAFKVLVMFVVLTILWTLWSTPTLSQFSSLVFAAGGSPLIEWFALGGIMIGLVLAGVLFQFLKNRGFSLAPVEQAASFGRSATITGATALLLVAAGTPTVQGTLGTASAGLLASAQLEHLNDRDEELMERGYYEGLLTSANFTSALWQTWKPKNWGLDQQHLISRETDDIFKKEMIPNTDVIFSGAPLQTNRWGMRDRDYELEKPAGTFRIALLGASHVMGMGVANDETFEAVLEERLNREFTVDGVERFEMLNFSVLAYTLLQQVAVNDHKIQRFSPDVVFYVAHPGERDRTLEGFVSRVSKDTELPYEYLRGLKERAKVSAELNGSEIRRRLEPFGDELYEWAYRHIAQSARNRGNEPFWIFMPFTHQETEQSELEVLARVARDAGFVTITLEDAYQEHPVPLLAVAPWDNHPNARAHRLVADRLFEKLTQKPGLL